MITHDFLQAKRLADEIILIEKGKFFAKFNKQKFLKNEKNVSYYFSHIIFYGLIISVFITFIGLYFAEKVFNIMGSTEEITNLGLQYTNIMFYGSFLFFLVVSLNSLLHAEGDTKTYRNVLVLSFLLNIILNPILILISYKFFTISFTIKNG